MDIGHFLTSLGLYAPGAQFLAYSLLTLASVTVAGTQLFLAYRQNFGWQPLILLTDQFIGLPTEAANYGALGYTVEVWNRRRYPIVVRSVVVDIKFIKPQTLIQRDPPEPKDWPIYQAKYLAIHPNDAIEPAAHKIYNPQTALASANDLEGVVSIQVEYFDPRLNGTRRIHTLGFASLLQGP